MSTIGDSENAARTALPCPQCQQENPPQWNYCARCGVALWEPCLSCGEPCAAGENFCGACGASLRDALEARVRRVEADFETASERAAALEFDAAITLLTPIASNSHPRLAEHAGRAEELVKQWTGQRRKRRKAADEACQLARHCLAAFDYDGAARFVDRVPPPFQSDTVRELQRQIAERRQEIDTLAAEIRQAVQERRWLDLPPRVERLLALKPDHAYANSVRDQVRKQFVVAAKKMLAEHRYDQARQFLEPLAADPADPEVKQLREQVDEMAWLAADLRNAPVIDATLVAVAGRLRRAAGGDSRIARMCTELDRRVRSAGSGPLDSPLPWARPPDQTPLGVPVEWLSGFRRIAMAEMLDRSELQRRPGSFATACGLALAPTGQAAIAINLLSASQENVLRRITRLARRAGQRPSWGIDVGGSSLKAVRLVTRQAGGQTFLSGEQPTIDAVSFVEHTKPLANAADDTERKQILTETLGKFLGDHDVRGDRLCVGVSGRTILSRQMGVPPADDDKTAKLVAFEAAKQFPLPLDQLAWDFHALPDTAGEPAVDAETSRARLRQVLLIAAKRTTTEPLLAVFKELGLRVDVLQPDFVALHNFLCYDYFAATDGASSPGSTSAVAALDIGCDTTNLLVSSPDSLWFRPCGIDGASFTRALVKDLGLDFSRPRISNANRKRPRE